MFAKLPLVTLFISNLTRLTAVVCMKVRFEAKVTRGFSLSPRRFRNSLSPLRGLLLISFAKKNQEKPLGPGYSFSPARRDSFRTQHHFYFIPKPPNSSSRLSLISFTDLLRLRSPGLPLLSSLVQFGFPQPFLERCYVTH